MGTFIKMIAAGLMVLPLTCAASGLNELRKLDCRAPNASAILEMNTGTIRGLIRGKAFNNNTIQIIEVVTDLPNDESDAIGGATVGRLGVGQVYVLFGKQQVHSLAEVESARIMHLDSDANVNFYPVECQLSFKYELTP